METKEYLWWIETIRQNNFRQRLPINIISWVSFTVCLIAFLTFLVITTKEVRCLLFIIGVVSLSLTCILVFLSSLMENRTKPQIEAIKQLHKKDKKEDLHIAKELNWFYGIDEESK
jgi:hypothetical protein